MALKKRNLNPNLDPSLYYGFFLISLRIGLFSQSWKKIQLFLEEKYHNIDFGLDVPPHVHYCYG